MNFDKSMIGRRVRDVLNEEDTGMVHSSYGLTSAWVDWAGDNYGGQRLHIPVRDLEFLEDDVKVKKTRSKKTPIMETITINGKLYKLVEI